MEEIRFVWMHDDRAINGGDEFHKITNLPSIIVDQFDDVELEYEYEPRLGAPGPFVVGTFIVTSAGVLLEFYRFLRSRDEQTEVGVTIEGENIYLIESKNNEMIGKIESAPDFQSGRRVNIDLEIESERIEELLKDIDISGNGDGKLGSESK